MSDDDGDGKEPPGGKTPIPDGFNTCPHCGSEDRVAYGLIIPEIIKAGGQVPARNRFGMGMVTMGVGAGKVVNLWFDCCAKCGTSYFVGMQHVTPIAIPRPIPGMGTPPGPGYIPRRNPFSGS